jgi:hypothetical protein
MSLLCRLGEEVSLVATVFNNFPLDVFALLLLQDSEQFSFVLLLDERISQEGHHPDIELMELKSFRRKFSWFDRRRGKHENLSMYRKY